MKLFAIIGTGGFGREVMPLARQAADLRPTAFANNDGEELVFVVDDGEPIPQRSINGHRVLTLSEFFQEPGERFYNIAIGNSKLRERISKAIPRDTAQPFTIAAPNHLSYDGNEVGEGAIFCAFTHVTSNAKIGKFFQCNIYSYVAHDCVIGDYVTFAPRVHCNGNVVIEDHAYIGTGAVIKHGLPDKPLRIGRGAVIGMGAVVTKDVPAGVTVVGNPARVVEK